MIKLFILWCIRTFTPTNIMWFFRAAWCWVFVWHKYGIVELDMACARLKCTDEVCERCGYIRWTNCGFHNSY